VESVGLLDIETPTFSIQWAQRWPLDCPLPQEDHRYSFLLKASCMEREANSPVADQVESNNTWHNGTGLRTWNADFLCPNASCLVYSRGTGSRHVSYRTQKQMEHVAITCAELCCAFLRRNLSNVCLFLQSFLYIYAGPKNAVFCYVYTAITMTNVCWCIIPCGSS
jgi:hypothetical protein